MEFRKDVCISESDSNRILLQIAWILRHFKAFFPSWIMVPNVAERTKKVYHGT